MAEQGGELDKSEEATPFKLRKAREQGSVARGVDLSFFAGLLALGGFLGIAGAATVGGLAQMMQRVLATGIAGAGDPQRGIDALRSAYDAALHPVLLFGGTILAVVALFEIVQLRGFVFSAHPLKPDLNRINLAAGLKRLFSMRLLKEAFKSIVKMAVYTVVAVLLVRTAVDGAGRAIGDAAGLVAAMRDTGLRLLWVFALLALVFAALDQVLARGEFRKQMKMSRRDVTREAREREGEPRLKRRRQQLHAEFAKQSAGLGALPGSDMVVVNPEHVAVALAYDRGRSGAPVVRAKARNLHAQTLKRRAAQLGIPILSAPPLARELYAACEVGAEIGEAQYHAVAELYYRLGVAAADPSPKEPR